MKKTLIAAALLAAFCFSGCRPAVNPDSGSPTPAPSGSVSVVVNTAVISASDDPDQQAPALTPGPASAQYEHAVSIVDGRLVAGFFDWEFFLAKAAAKHPAEVVVCSAEGGVETVLSLSRDENGFTASLNGSVQVYPYLVKLTVPEGQLAVMTDEEGVTAESFFTGSDPAAARVGTQTEKGLVVFTDLVG